MTTSFRQQEIVELARRARRVTVEELAERFNVTRQTIRRDLAELCEARVLARTHGGAMLASGVANAGYADRAATAGDSKTEIARLCAAHIPDDCSLFINIGTTTEAVARALSGHRNLLVITNNLNVANTLAQNPHCEVIVAGGVLRRSDNGLVGEATVDFIRQFKVDHAIIGASAVDADGALLDYDFREVRVAQAIISNARRSCLVADATKFTRTAPVRIARLTDLDALFTDETPPQAIDALCREHGVAVHVAGGRRAEAAE
ncbi:DeoR/GlpR family DNA-binding transcription regulator [Rubrimonas cliftonensis]|nr:DeoR/GlpR family DNA-binding transcription regulator [Rubrimonas cliftonensis]